MMHEVFFFCIFFHIDEKVQGLFKLVRISSKLLNQAIVIYKKGCISQVRFVTEK